MTALNRILSLDVYRGLTIILMILVNSQGNDYAYPILEHAPWNGCTLADLVFPSFLFIVGLTSVVSLQKQLKTSPRHDIYRSILKRSLLLFMIGMFLNVFPNHIDLSYLRFYGILQRIAVCYLIVCLIYLNTETKTQVVIFLSILLGYWAVMTLIPVPGFGANQLTSEGSWVAYFDQLLFSPRHLLAKFYDPEGFFSTIPAVATTLSGLLMGTLLLTPLSQYKKLYWLVLIGIVFLITGWLWSYSFPINKNLWTSTYVLWTSGISIISFALCFWLIDILGYTQWTLPLKIFGMNALFAFILHVLLLKIQFVFYYPLKDGSTGNLKAAITEYLFGSLNSQNGALLYSLVFLLLNFGVVSYLYKRKIFMRL